MVTICSPDFDINQIANSGQCFRITEISEKVWEVMAGSRRLLVKQKESSRVRAFNPIVQSYIITETPHILECSQGEYEDIWSHYFDMLRDYSSIKSKVVAVKDPYLIKAVNFGCGLRILQQDPWEMLISFIISQRNNINRIRKIIKTLCAPYGLRFPSAQELSKYSEEDFYRMGLGYRAKYVRDAALAVSSGSLNLESLRNMSYEEIIKCLKNQNGIGDKVANCIALFGFQKLEAFPIDTWIMKVLEREYGAGIGKNENKTGTLNLSNFQGYAGIVQQYMFYYERFRGLLTH